MLAPMPDLMPETAPTLRAHINVSGHKRRPLAAGALYWEAEDTLLVADLHLEKGAAFAALGMLLPPYDTRTTLERLSKGIQVVNPARAGCRRGASLPPPSPPAKSPDPSIRSRALRGGARRSGGAVSPPTATA